MPPKFSLQPVLDFRHSRVEALEVELGHMLAAQQRAQAYLEALKDYRVRLQAELQRQQVGEMDLWVINQVRSTIRTVEDRIEQQKVELARMEQQLALKRQEVVVAKQGEETLATLKNKEVERYQVEVARQESRIQDDIYIAQAFRKMGSPQDHI